MGDPEEAGVFWESWTWTPQGEEKKKDPKKERKRLKRKNSATKKTEQDIERKKKKSPKEKKENKKGKKQKRSPSELDDGLILAPAVRPPRTLDPRSTEKLQRGRDRKRKSSGKPKVAFNLPPSVVSAGPAGLPSSRQRSPREKVLSEPEAVAGVRPGRRPPGASQSPGEDVNSQDLFITQKAFRASPSQPSSGDDSDRAVFPPRRGLHPSEAQNPRLHVQKTVQVQVRLTDGEEDEEAEEEEERMSQTHPDPEEGKWFKADVAREKRVPLGPFQLSPSLDAARSGRPPCASREPPLSGAPRRLHTSTQTENFFSTELCCYLAFCRRSGGAGAAEDPRPLDLSVRRGARKDPGDGSPGKTLSSAAERKEADLRPRRSSDAADGAPTEEPSGRPPPCARPERKATPSPPSESDPRTADTSASSEDEPPCRGGRLNLTQVRAVQMRLNESFFFKTKGERQSPRPQSPLMKLAQGRQVKSRKAQR
uniref:serine/arginine repetitive matrix protein 2 n=1 Tax=Gasterosteus aculeatus aculeatus TaxID=481459 RepID=UPI001A9A0A94|nr:serine/arginine repetitive matrix protein 2 [Gasterosteus aculeatus aculeatus]